MQVASADDPAPLSVSGHETRVLGNRSCRFGRRGALNGVTSEIMQMYTHHLTGNSRSVPSRTWVSPQWTCCRRQQSGEGLDTHIIVLWQCTECKGPGNRRHILPNSRVAVQARSVRRAKTYMDDKDPGPMGRWVVSLEANRLCGAWCSTAWQR